MNIKLEKIVIFNSTGDKREVKFENGLNIITGHAQKGKSALLKIIDYCLYSDSSNIPEGVITEFASIFVVIFKIDTEFVIVAREKINKSNCFIFKQTSIENLSIVDFNEDVVKTSIDASKLLLKYFGVNVPKDLTIDKGNVSVRNMIPLLLQPQNVIANEKEVFMGFENTFKNNATRSDFLFFIKIADNNYLKIKRRIEQIGVEIRNNIINTNSRGEILNDLKSNLELKINDFLKNLKFDIQEKTFNEIINLNFDEIFDRCFNDERYNETFKGDELNTLQRKRVELSRRLQEINNKINLLDNSVDEIAGYYNESNLVHEMLDEVIGLSSNSHSNKCPLCSSVVKGLDGEIAIVRNINKSLNEEIEQIKKYSLDIEDRKPEHISQKKQLRSQINQLNERIGILQKENTKENVKSIYEKLLVLKTEINIEKSLYLKMIQGLETIEDNNSENDLVDEKKRLEGELPDIEEYKNHLSDLLNEKITTICGMLDIEDRYKSYELKFDMDTFKVFFEKNTLDGIEPERIYINQIGSGANQLAIHLSLFLGLLWLSLKTNSYLPKVIYVDQPSQVYFPEISNGNEEITFDQEDVKKVANLYIVVLDQLNSMKVEFGYLPQIIINDHANNLNLGKYKFTDYVRENWRGRGLI